jgi:hypothetical protein
LGEVDIAAVVQFKAHHLLHDPVKPFPHGDRKVRRSEAIREVAEGGQSPIRLLAAASSIQNNSGLPHGPTGLAGGRLSLR